MMAPQIIVITMTVIALILGAVVDGLPKEGKHRFSVIFVSNLINQALLIWGGFYN